MWIVHLRQDSDPGFSACGADSLTTSPLDQCYIICSMRYFILITSIQNHVISVEIKYWMGIKLNTCFFHVSLKVQSNFDIQKQAIWLCLRKQLVNVTINIKTSLKREKIHLVHPGDFLVPWLRETYLQKKTKKNKSHQ